MQIKGKFLKRLDPISKGNYTTYKFWVQIDENSQYPQTIEFHCPEKTDSYVQKIDENSLVSVEFELRGRLWTNKDGVDMVFNTISAWKIEALKSENEPVQTPPIFHDAVVVSDPILSQQDDLPF